MTLITYPVRAHFADGVLEEALRSELETHGFHAPIIIGEQQDSDGEFIERLYSGLPRGCRPILFSIQDGMSKSEAVAQLRPIARRHKADVLIAFGSVRAISYARKCRQNLQQDRKSNGLIDLFAIPGVDGLPGPCRERPDAATGPFDLGIRTGLPNILICDPTVTLGADPDKSVKAAVTTLVQCLEAYLSDAFNPPADGMALDGLHRAIRYLPEMGAETIEMRREMMAAAFNAMLCRQKGIGPAQTISDALRICHQGGIDSDAAASLLLPGVLRSQASDAAKIRVVRKAMDLADDVLLPEGVTHLTRLQKVKSLSQLGVTRGDLARAARCLSDSLTLPTRPGGSDVLTLMEDVF